VVQITVPHHHGVRIGVVDSGQQGHLMAKAGREGKDLPLFVRSSDPFDDF
jgi:hypothetical protein